VGVELLTTQEAAEELRVSRRTLYELVRKGEIRWLDLGHRTKRITRAELNRYIAKLNGAPCN